MFRDGQQIGPYALVRKLGKGGFGEVWLAEKRTELVTKKVAIKLPHGEQINLDSIKQEAMLWEEASGHPNVLPIIDADIYDGQVVIVSEFADGGSLHEWLKERNGKAPSIEKAVELMTGILSGLVHLHSHKITHRDLKPNNILLHGETPRITDFGVSRVVEHNSQGTEALGTPIYMSPEAFQKSMSPKTDIWSAGVVFYEMLSGTYPFYDDDVFALMDSIRTEKAKPLPREVPLYLREFVEKALEREPEKRFQNALEMRNALAAFSLSAGPKHLSEVMAAAGSISKPDFSTPNRQFFETTTLSFVHAKHPDISVETQSRIPAIRKFPRAWLALPALLLIGIGGSAFWWTRPDLSRSNENLPGRPAANEAATIEQPLTPPDPSISNRENSDGTVGETPTAVQTIPIASEQKNRDNTAKKAPATAKPKMEKKPSKTVTFEDLIKDRKPR